MVPHQDNQDGCFFVADKLGLEVAYMGSVEEEMMGEESEE